MQVRCVIQHITGGMLARIRDLYWRPGRVEHVARHAVTPEEEAEAIELQRLAEQFDATDAGELAWEEATDVEIGRTELEQISIRLPREDLAELKRRAQRTGVG